MKNIEKLTLEKVREQNRRRAKRYYEKHRNEINEQRRKKRLYLRDNK